MPCALLFALVKAGNSIAARIAMMAMTTNSSISVKPCLYRGGLPRAVAVEFFIGAVLQRGFSLPAPSGYTVATAALWREPNVRPGPIIGSELIGTVFILKRPDFKCNRKTVVF